MSESRPGLTLDTPSIAHVPTNGNRRGALPRILYVIGGEQIGGSERHLLRLLPHLSDFHVGVCCFNAGRVFFDHLRTARIETFDLGIPDLLSLSRLLKLKHFLGTVRSFRPHIIHSYGYTNDVLVPIFALAAGRPHVIGSRRGRDSSKRHQLLRSLTNPLCDRVVCVSEDTADFVRRTERINGALIRVIPNGVPLRSRPCGARDRNSRVRFGTLGRVAPVKGTDLLVDAFLKFDRNAHVELQIAGTTESAWAEQLMSKVVASPHADKVKFLGFEGDTQSFLSGLDVFVLPSRSEGMSNALLEAMACGLPCIATDVGSNASLLRDKRIAGLVCKPTAMELYDCMVQLREDERFRVQLGTAARGVVETEYSMQKMADRYMRLYLELLQS